MTDPITFPRPLRATAHCRHYSYQHGDLAAHRGPKCALGLDLSAPGASSACWPGPQAICDQRQEYSDEERAVWRAWVVDGMKRLEVAIAALPAPLALNSSGIMHCPNCGGDLHFGRWHRGAAVQCSTENCCGARLNIAPGADWPAPKAEGGAA